MAWVAVDAGRCARRRRSPPGRSRSSSRRERGDPIDFVAEGDTRFVLGSAAKHRHELALGNYSVHTSTEALLRGEAEIRRIGQRLLADGTLQPLT